MRAPSTAWSEDGASLTWTIRIMLGILAIGGSAAYALSFRVARHDTLLAALGPPVALAAGLSWLVFGAALLLAARSRPSPLAWADACLVTMGVGMAALLLAVPLNLSGRATASTHLGILLLSNVAMAIVFARRARALGLPVVTAVALWLFVLDGAFLILFLLLLGVMA